jgi:calpain-7
MYPYDNHNDLPMISHNGRYMFRFYFNGSYRLVDVDDTLPLSKSDRILHITDRNNPGLLWPALLEKAYLKLRAGGYDWDGSNSATDLWIIIGWIPEIIILQE